MERKLQALRQEDGNHRRPIQIKQMAVVDLLREGRNLVDGIFDRGAIQMREAELGLCKLLADVQGFYILLLAELDVDLLGKRFDRRLEIGRMDRFANCLEDLLEGMPVLGGLHIDVLI
jgi:hypothetical protein